MDGEIRLVDNIQRFKDTFNNLHINERKFFNPYRLENLSEDPGVKGYPVMFITTPRLNLTDKNIMNDEFMAYLGQVDPELLGTLNYGSTTIINNSDEGKVRLGTSSPFITILSNMFHSFSAKSTQALAKEIGETHYGYRQYLPGPTINSRTGDTCSVSFHENKDLDVLRLHKVWSDYIEHVSRGTMKPSQNAISERYIDYTSSIYYFLIDFDGETIQYYQKLTGCAPFNVPYDSLSGTVGGAPEAIEYSIEYGYSYKEDMDPSILSDFNAVSQKAPSLISFKEFDRQLYTADNKYSVAEHDYDHILDEDLTILSHPVVVLDGYAGSEKKRYKLKYVSSGSAVTAS